MNDPLEAQPSLLPSLVSTKRVPNVFPTNPNGNYRLAIVGEAPGQDEEAYGLPFVGASGKLLDGILGSVGIDRTACFIGNVCQFRPPGNDIKAFGYEHEKVVTGKAELLHDLELFQPNCILALGNTPLWALTGHPFGLHGSTHSVSDYSCFILRPNVSFCTKIVAAYHPAFVLREYRNWVMLRFAAHRARVEAETHELVLPIRTFELDLSAAEIVRRLDSWPSGLPASIDIEGGLGGWVCMSVVSTPDTGFIVAFGQHSAADQGRIYVAVSRFLARHDIPKVLQNSLYEGFVLTYGFNMVVNNIREDTMLKQWEIYPELPKGLDTIASIWTREPQWKFLIAYSLKEQKRRKALPDHDPAKEIRNKHLACCIDSAVTLEASLAQDNALLPGGLRHYRDNVELLNPLLYMELRGIKYNSELAKSELAQVAAALAETGSRLALRAGYDLRGTKGSLSSTKLKRCLYEEKSYPEQKKGRGPTAKVSTDVEALLNLSRKFPNDPFLADILLHRKLESIQETLEVQTDPDGRVRCGYNLVGTETGRLTCYTSPTGSGANLQTITKKLRKLYVADDGYWLFQCDLSGADGWTVAARCLAAGDPTMWDDYRFGLKPAKIICLMKHYGHEVNRVPRPELKALCDKESAPGGICDQDSWEYFGCKRVQHMSNYDGKAKTGVKQIMIDSYKITGQAFYMTETEFELIQKCYFTRYNGLRSWHLWAAKQVLDGHDMTMSSGHTRKFFGRRRGWNPKTRTVEADHDTFKEFLASEPQHYTTYATNLAMGRLWTDVENRREGVYLRDAGETLRATLRGSAGGLYIPPTHQVHDALLGQIPRERTEWACGKIREWFSNTITIANTQLIIPFEGAYGPSWGEQGAKYGGGTI